ncbi:MAG: hypothetical protein P3W93_003750 [Thermus sp.]|nr:hypothetical protein [Thermus sp.]
MARYVLYEELVEEESGEPQPRWGHAEMFHDESHARQAYNRLRRILRAEGWEEAEEVALSLREPVEGWEIAAFSGFVRPGQFYLVVLAREQTPS